MGEGALLQSLEELGPGSRVLQTSALGHPAHVRPGAHQQRAQRYNLGHTARQATTALSVTFQAVGPDPKQDEKDLAALGRRQITVSQRDKGLRWHTGRPGTFVIFK